MFHIAHKFYRTFLEDVIMTFFECSIKWIIKDEYELERMRLVCIQSQQRKKAREEENRKRRCTEERGKEDVKNKKKSRNLEVQEDRVESISTKYQLGTNTTRDQWNDTLSKRNRSNTSGLKGTMNKYHSVTEKLLAATDELITPDDKDVITIAEDSVSSFPSNTDPRHCFHGTDSSEHSEPRQTLSPSTTGNNDTEDDFIIVLDDKDSLDEEDGSDSDSLSVIYDGLHLGNATIAANSGRARRRGQLSVTNRHSFSTIVLRGFFREFPFENESYPIDSVALPLTDGRAPESVGYLSSSTGNSCFCWVSPELFGKLPILLGYSHVSFGTPTTSPQRSRTPPLNSLSSLDIQVTC